MEEKQRPSNNIHRCAYADYQYIKGAGDIYICRLTQKNCPNQYYCHDVKCWKPTSTIKCTQFVQYEQGQNPPTHSEENTTS